MAVYGSLSRVPEPDASRFRNILEHEGVEYANLTGFVIRNGRLPDAAGDRLIDTGFSKDRIAAIESNIISEAPFYDAEGCLCCGGLIETHIHLDKSRIATAVRRSLVGVLRSSGEADLHGGGYLYACEGDARELHQAAVPRSRN